MKILVLHSRLSGYWMACMQSFVEEYEGDFFVVRKKVSANAPFDFENEKGIQLFNFSDFSSNELMEFSKEINPDLVYVSGWSEQSYLKVCRHFKKRGVPVLCGLDNHWEGTIRQQAGKLYLKNIIPNTFTHLWIAGLYQFEYARQLGFRKENILTGVYSADVNAFAGARKKSSEEIYPKSFLFVGRLIERKGLMELAQAFQQLKKTTDTAWSLILIGNGPLKKKLNRFDCIEILDFVQPKELPGVMSQHGVFVLPSLVEPWGVVLHEAVSAGLPVISTHNCGAGTAFIRNGYNGYLTQAGNINSLNESLRKITKLGDEQLYAMGNRSYELSRQYTPHTWASTLKEIILESY